jgi:hypothetical protein
MRSLVISAAAVVLLIAPVAHAQDEMARKKMAEGAVTRVPLESSVKGAPYSADIVVESTQTLADGNHIANRNVGHVFRDGEGRTRREQDGTASVLTRTEPVVSTKGPVISIVDPVAGFSYSLDPEHKIAWRTSIGASKELLDKIQSSITYARDTGQAPTTDEQKAAAEKAMVKLKELAQQEAVARGGGEPGNVTMRARAYALAPETPLEHKTIEGIPVDGRQTTEVIPAGKIGNELPITITSEEWRSPDLKVLVFTRHSDPRTGESTYKLTNVVRAEPDPSLFIVPPDYTVKDTGIRRNNE